MGPILFLVFIVVPLLELLVIIQVGQWIGGVPTILALLAISLTGAALVKREGLRAWQRFRQALAEGRVPTKEVIDGALLLFGGALLLTPGFLTDAVGLTLLVPFGRTAVRRALRGRVHLIGGPLGASARSSRGSSGPRGSARSPGGSGNRPPPAGDDEIIDVEVVDIERDDPRKP